MDIYFLRHASAGQPRHGRPGDDKRPLDKEGIQQCHDVGAALKALKTKLDEIISSPLTRAHQTAEIAAGELGHKRNIVFTDALRPEADYAQFQGLLGEYQDRESIMVVGHNPSLTEFLNRLLHGDGAPCLELKKGAVAKVEQESAGTAGLKWLLTPKLARALKAAKQTGAASTKSTKAASAKRTHSRSSRESHAAAAKSSRPKTRSK